MKKIIIVSLLFLFLIFFGCSYHKEPENNQEFQKETKLSHLAGIYYNLGDPKGFLSEILWGNLVPHEDVELVHVSVSGKQVVVSAIKNGCIFYTMRYVEGQDFQINDGKITLSKNMAVISRGAGDPLVGPSSYTVELGLDTEGHGKYQSREYLAGLVFWLVPVAASETRDVRFSRYKENKLFDHCAESIK